MDLHVIGPLASPAERAAVDAVLGPAESGWHGGRRDAALEGHVARGGHEARARRDLLIPVLHSIQSRVGWISQPALNYVSRRLTIPPAEAWGVATFYALFATMPRPPVVAHVCDDLACALAGATDVCADLERAVGPEGAPLDDGAAAWLRSPCLGLCERAPAVMVTQAGEAPMSVASGPVDAAGVVGRLRGDRRAARADERSSRIPQAGQPGLHLLARVDTIDPTSLDAYRSGGGFRALERARAIGAPAVIDEVAASGLVGRGGAAFPTGRKWAAVAAQPAQPHHLVVNADESEPGTFSNRVLMEGDPFAVVESTAIAAFAVGAAKAYVYIRGEYPLAEARLEDAIRQSTEAGLLGDLDIEIRRGAGAYICGEETALFESIEGKRGEPRNKPPFPVEVGLFGKPTAINNVETLVNVPLIVGGEGGAAAWKAMGTEGSAGPKLFCVSGHVAAPGVYEVPFGVTLRELIELAGGVPSGRPIRAVLLGGAAGVFVGPDALDVPLTFEGTRAIGATLGSGVVMVFDESADLVGALTRIARFFRDESCGQCVPCRVGTVRQEELLARLASGRAAARGKRDDELSLLTELGKVMRDASICGLGQTASSAIESAFRQPGMVAL
ncbi:MAG TPA: NAD(P)H-dependent oxidoreductase subunit E [Candidatus Limnocylindrales bacterium]|nr:NAD(P)H-dependent oxidoreductase subunit E [Candidatus Limnocylindrales bacterium]